MSKLRLDMLAPDGSVISGWTTIPDDIRLDSASVNEGRIYTCFTTSPDNSRNYFILHIQALENNHPKDRTTHNLGESVLGISLGHWDELRGTEKTDSIVVTLKRFYCEGFHYQLSTKDAEDANCDNLVLSSPLAGNLIGAIGIFTCFTKDRICFR